MEPAAGGGAYASVPGRDDHDAEEATDLFLYSGESSLCCLPSKGTVSLLWPLLHQSVAPPPPPPPHLITPESWPTSQGWPNTATAWGLQQESGAEAGRAEQDHLWSCSALFGRFMTSSLGRRWMKTLRTQGDMEWVWGRRSAGSRGQQVQEVSRFKRSASSGGQQVQEISRFRRLAGSGGQHGQEVSRGRRSACSRGQQVQEVSRFRRSTG